MKTDYIIRHENQNDYSEVENLAREAFWNLYVPGCNEHFLIHTMRDHEDFIPELDYVLELDGRIIASIMYTRAYLVDQAGTKKPVISFGPVCVHPDYQRQGYGKALLEFTFEKARELGYDVIIIFGNPSNYVARGFKSCVKYNVYLENGICPMAMMLKELVDGVFDGRKWTYYGSSFDEKASDAQAVEKFDKNFPQKLKAWQPSQEEFYIHCHSVTKE